MPSPALSLTVTPIERMTSIQRVTVWRGKPLNQIDGISNER